VKIASLAVWQLFWPLRSNFIHSFEAETPAGRILFAAKLLIKAICFCYATFARTHSCAFLARGNEKIANQAKGSYVNGGEIRPK
jgi:hypothetical protein